MNNFSLDELRFFGRVVADNAHVLPELYNPLLAVIHDKLSNAATGAPLVFDSLPLPEFRGEQLAAALRECFTLASTLELYGRFALSEAIGGVLQVLIRWTRASQDEIALEYLADMQRRAVENGASHRLMN